MFTHLVIAALCANAITELIRHDGRLANFRVMMETLNGGPIQRFFKGVIGCGWCLSHWAAIVTTFALIFPYLIFSTSVLALLLYLIAFSLAATRAANWFNDYFKGYWRTPRAPERDHDGTI
jgi:hypothetical protein